MGTGRSRGTWLVLRSAALAVALTACQAVPTPTASAPSGPPASDPTQPATAPHLPEVVSDPRALAAWFAALRLGVAPSDIIQLGYEQPFVTVGGARVWTGLFGVRGRDDQLFVAVNMVTGEVMDQAGFRLLFVTAAPTASLRPAEPTPPSSFDPAAVTWFAVYGASGGGLWSGAIDGSGLRNLLPPVGRGRGPYQFPTQVGADVVYLDFSQTGSAGPHGGGAQLRMIRADGTNVLLLDDVHAGYAVDPVTRVAYAGRFVNRLDDGLWRVPLDGGAAERYLPPLRGIATTGMRVSVAAGSDGRVASSFCPGPMQVSFGDEPRTLDVYGLPLGFDTAGRLVYLATCSGRGWPSRLSPSGEIELLAPEDAGYDALVLPGGRYLVYTNEFLFGDMLLVLDLESGHLERVPLAPGPWAATPWTTERYVVLLRPSPLGINRGQTYAIYDRLEGWVGYLERPIPPP